MADEAEQLEADELAPIEPEAVTETVEAVEPEPLSRRDELARAFDRPRDEAGRYASTEPAEIAAAEEPAQITDEDLQKLGLKKEEFDHFRNPAAVSAFKRRMEESTAGYEKLQGNAEFGANIRNAIQPYMATIESTGMTPDQAVKTMFSADHALRYGTQEQKVAMLRSLAQSYGIDGLSDEQAEPADPTIAALQNELYQIRQQTQQFFTAQQQQAASEVNAKIAAFREGREHFETVRDDMAMLMENGKANDLEAAYNLAVRLNPEISEKLDAKQREEAEKTRREQATQAARKAKAAAVSVTGSPIASKPTPPPHDLRATIDAAIAEIGR